MIPTPTPLIDLPAFPFARRGLIDAIDPVPDRADLAPAWERCRGRLRAEVGLEVFESWFGRLEFDGMVGDVARLSVPTTFLKTWLQSHYLDRVAAVLSAEIEGVRTVSIGVRSSSRSRVDHARAAGPPPMTVAPPMRAARPGPASPPFAESDDPYPLSGSRLDRRMTFDSFVPGCSNQLARVSAERIATGGGLQPPALNLLFIHGATGLGKTHLLQAVAHAVSASGRRAVYLTAEAFMYGFVYALKAQTTLAFPERLRAIDVLLIDDVQFLQGKSIQQEFARTIDSLIVSGKQIVIAADRPPSDLETLEERVRSRLAGGLCVEMGSLDEALRVKILETRIAVARGIDPSFEVSPAVIAYVASVIQTNGRDLDGAVNRLMAHASLTQASLCVETAEVAIRDLVRTREPKRVKIEDIQKLVATHYNVSRVDILSSRRTADIVRPRQIAMYLSKILTLRSLPEIGRRFGGRDHTTVLHAVRRIEALREREPAARDEIDGLRAMLGGSA